MHEVHALDDSPQRFSKRAYAEFAIWRESNSPEALARVLCAIQDELSSSIDRQLHGGRWSCAQTISDAYQELQRKALEHGWDASEYPRLENLANKAFVCLLNYITDRLRARANTSRRPLDDVLFTLTHDRGPVDDAISRDTAAFVDFVIGTLRPDWREALRMKYQTGYSDAAIARVLEKPSEDAVRMLLVRARKELASRLEAID